MKIVNFTAKRQHYIAHLLLTRGVQFGNFILAEIFTFIHCFEIARCGYTGAHKRFACKRRQRVCKLTILRRCT